MATGERARRVAPFARPLAEFGRYDLALAGGKGANLGELVAAGLPVPDGFVVTTDAYARVAAEPGPAARLAELAAGGGDGAAARAALVAAAVPEGLREAIAAAYRRLGGGAVAVRSSATAEDLPGAAFAGQQDTFLNVVGEAALLDAVRRCWASLWSERAIAYRARRARASAEVRIAVVVQRMIDAEAAGVLFTADPVSGDHERLVIDASAGLGEAVVAGLVTPDHYVVDPAGHLLEWTPGRGEVIVRPAPAGGVVHERAAGAGPRGADDAAAAGVDDADGADGAGPTADPSTAGGRASGGRPAPAPILAAATVAELARLGARVAERMGRPQDVEWALAAGRVWLLQARPMTALPPPVVRLNRRQRLLGSMLLEYLPIRPYPIDATTWLPHGPAGLMARVAASLGVRNAFDGFLVEVDGVVERLEPPSPRPTWRVLAAPFRLARRARRHDPARWTEDPRFEAFGRDLAALAAHDPAALPWTRLLRLPRQALDRVRPIADLRIDYLPRAGFALARLFLTLRLLGRGRLLGPLLTGVPTRTEDANRALEGLARRVREDPGLRRAFAEREPERLPEAVAGHPQVHAAFAAYLAEYGHRETASPILVTPPTLGEAPGTVLGLVKVLAAEDTAPGGDPSAPARDRGDEALRSLLAYRWLRGPRARARMRRWVAAARAGVAFREDSHFHFTRPLPILRAALLEIGRRLVAAGVLATPEDLFHLRLEELEALPDDGRPDERHARHLRDTVARRAARREELGGVPLINPRSIFPAPEGDADVLVSGTPAAAGSAAGPVRVILDPAGFATLRRGEVLVCPYTNPSWTPLFARAAAVVVDSGGVGSHAAIVAREYGIPAVMGTAVGTRVLTDGRWVRVDGGRGRVVAAPAGPAR